ncbi:MAG: SDR family oxidoreductase [Pirellulales bacterium]|nr:SDR family oxidoreductase [Pirellulales bacterium]
MNSAPQHFVVIGANGGIGSALCRRLRNDRHSLTLAGRNEAEIAELANELDSPFEVVDASSVEQVEACLKGIAASTGTIGGVVNCAGSVLLKPAHLTTPDDWQATIATNLTSAFATVRAAHGVLRENGGSIVLVSSAAARTGLPNHEAIAAAKAGVIGLTLSAAATYAAKKIRINAVAPGLVRTKLTERIWNNERAASASQTMHALGRLGEPEDVASLIAWLLAPENSWITGQVFGVDGGLATLRAVSR